jgi:hypothetical protein
MPNPASLSQLVETYRFPDLVVLLARERLEHESIVASALARAVIRDGLRLQSASAQLTRSSDKPIEFRGYPYVGYTAHPEGVMSVLRSSALAHLFAIVERGEPPAPEKLHEEFVGRNDFRNWLMARDLPLPRFWYGKGTEESVAIGSPP